MLWWVLDLALVVLGLGLLAALALRLYRQVRALAREVGAAGRRIEQATARLDALAARQADPTRRSGPSGGART